jgi:hypothetical protein
MKVPLEYLQLFLHPDAYPSAQCIDILRIYYATRFFEGATMDRQLLRFRLTYYLLSLNDDLTAVSTLDLRDKQSFTHSCYFLRPRTT